MSNTEPKSQDKKITPSQMAEALRVAGWCQHLGGAWYEPARPDISMSLRTAYYTHLRGHKKIVVHKQ